MTTHNLLAGQPVAWCISDQETTEVIELFLSTVQRKSPDAQVSVVMTDDGECKLSTFYYN